jgi:hypothetical protein
MRGLRESLETAHYFIEVTAKPLTVRSSSTIDEIIAPFKAKARKIGQVIAVNPNRQWPVASNVRPMARHRHKDLRQYVRGTKPRPDCSWIKDLASLVRALSRTFLRICESLIWKFLEFAMRVPTVAVEMMVWTNEAAEQSTNRQRQINPLLHELTLEDPFNAVYAASQRIDALNRALAQPQLIEWTRATPCARYNGIHPALWKAAAMANLDDVVAGSATEFDFAELQRLALKFAHFAGHS